MPCAELLDLILKNETQQYTHHFQPLCYDWTAREIREGDILCADVNGSICPTGRNYARVVKWSNHKKNPKIKLEMLQYDNENKPHFQDCGWCDLEQICWGEPFGKIWIFKHKFWYTRKQ